MPQITQKSRKAPLLKLNFISHGTLEERYDREPFRRIGLLGPLAGASCLEVGAGAGSVRPGPGPRSCSSVP